MCFMHNALCVHWKDGRVVERAETLPESQTDLPLTLSLYFFIYLFWKQSTSLMWPFSVWHKNKGIFSLFPRVLLLLSLTISLSFPSIFHMYVSISPHKFGKCSGYMEVLSYPKKAAHCYFSFLIFISLDIE